MQTEENNDVVIVVSSSDQATRAYFTNMVREQAMADGFLNVDVRNTSADTVPDISTLSLWEMIREDNPTFRETTQVSIWSSPEPDAYQKLATSADMVDAARPQYPTPEEAEAAGNSDDPVLEY